MDALGIDTADIGLPGAGGTHAAGVELMAREIAEKKLKIRPNCAARTHRNDIIPIVEISQRAGIPIEACTFIGSSAIRFFAEDWTLDKLLKLTEDAVTFAVSEGVPVMYVTEDTTRANPETIRALYTTAIRCGAKAVCVCDTVGHSTPDGARAVVKFVKEHHRRTGRRHPARLARASGSRTGCDQFDRRNSGRRGSGSWFGTGHGRARRQYADGPVAGQPKTDGLDR